MNKSARALRMWIKVYCHTTSHPDDHAERKPLTYLSAALKEEREQCAKELEVLGRNNAAYAIRMKLGNSKQRGK